MEGNDQPAVKPRTCHKCHCPLNDPHHAGVQSGVENCSLDHWSGCPGGKQGGPDGNGRAWSACPVAESIEENNLEEKNDDVFKNGSTSTLPASLDEAVKLLEKFGLDKKSGTVSISSNDSSDDEELRIQREEIEKMKLDMAKHAKDKKKADKKERRRLEMESLEAEKALLLGQAKVMQDSTKLAPKPVSTQSVRTADALKVKAAELAASQQQHAAAQATNNQRLGFNIAGIRALPGMSAEVEQYLTRLQSIVPSLAKAPSASVAPGPAFQPPGVLGSVPGEAAGGEDHSLVQEDGDVDPGFVYIPTLGKLVRVVQASPQRSGNQTSHARSTIPTPEVVEDGDSDASEDNECPLRPEPGFEFVWKRDIKGKKYFVSEPVRNQTKDSPNYIYDKQTGRTYRDVSSTQDQKLSQPSRKVKPSAPNTTFVDHRQDPKHQKTSIVYSSQHKDDDRVPTFLASDCDKKGKDTKLSDVVQWARDCPVSWTDKVTMDKLNVVLFSWSYVSSLLAARTGRAPDLAAGELESRLQHLLHVLEITLQTSTLSDFSGDSWKIARLYHSKVQQKVDSSQSTWVQLTEIHHNATLPHELMAAMQELGNKPKLRGDGTRGDGTRGEGGRGSGGRAGDKVDPNLRKEKRTCPTWNKSEIKGKCGFETEHPSLKCRYAHECSWCKFKSLSPLDHQRSFCRRKQERDAEDD